MKKKKTEFRGIEAEEAKMNKTELVLEAAASPSRQSQQSLRARSNKQPPPSLLKRRRVQQRQAKQ